MRLYLASRPYLCTYVEQNHGFTLCVHSNSSKRDAYLVINNYEVVWGLYLNLQNEAFMYVDKVTAKRELHI